RRAGRTDRRADATGERSACHAPTRRARPGCDAATECHINTCPDRATRPAGSTHARPCPDPPAIASEGELNADGGTTRVSGRRTAYKVTKAARLSRAAFVMMQLGDTAFQK
ncbi:MAG TPA: hypothetical protein VF258_00355, partial [Luteolibacter sp.]